MFCPNCGTQNPDAATTCSKCGFNLKGASAPKFKGTMLMMNAPANVPRPNADAGGAQTGPVPAASSATPAEAAAAAVRPKLKGTMLGVAPPSAGSAPAPVPEPAPGVGAAAPAPAYGPADPLGGTVAAGPGFPGPAVPGAAVPTTGSAAAVPMGAQPMGAQPMGAQPMGAQPVAPTLGGQALDAPPMGAPPMGAPPMGAPPMGAPPMGAPPMGAPPMGAPVGAMAPMGAPAAGFGAPPMGAPGAMPPAGAIAPMPAAGIATTARGPVGKTRNPIMVLLLGSVSCGLYAIWTIYSMANELNQFRQKSDVNPLLCLFYIGMFSVPNAVVEARQLAGMAPGSPPNAILYILAWWWFLVNDLNEVWEAAKRTGG